MSRTRLLLLGLDGLELSLVERLMADGLLPNLRRLRENSARVRLDHGRAKDSGLAWEHVSLAKGPEAARRWSAVTFDPKTYQVRQQPTDGTPFPAALGCRTVVFDPPYFDLAKAPGVRGMTSWGAHDPGVDPAGRPRGLWAEVEARFGPYPAKEHVYGFSWPSPERTRRAAAALERAVDVRADIAEWLLAERLPDWDLAVVVVSEPHSAVEPMWHGVDASHPLHALPSAAPAAEGLRRVYEAVDRMVGRLADAFPDAGLTLLSMHGMGSNEADVPAMALLPELLFRHAFGRAWMREPRWPACTPDGAPLLDAETSWDGAMARLVPPLSRIFTQAPGGERRNPEPSNIDWMPSARYRPFWPAMPAFALPSFYDGRIRINLQGREAQGRTPLDRYPAVVEQLAELLQACRDPSTGEPVIREVYTPAAGPMEMNGTEADLTVLFRGHALAFEHPEHGRIGPVPYRRTGGHTGACGFLWLDHPEVAPGDHGVADSLDAAPTVADLLGETPAEMSGASLAPRLRGMGARIRHSDVASLTPS